MYVLPDSLRDTLKGYIGQLVDEQKLLQLLHNKKNIITVGDRVTYTLLKHGLHPCLCIVDYILEREPYPVEMKQLIQSYGKKRMSVVNPPKIISDELWDAIQWVFDNVQECPVVIEVNGEEDLASLAAIYLAPVDATIIYGLPNKGVVVVTANKAHKQKVHEVLQQMK